MLRLHRHVLSSLEGEPDLWCRLPLPPPRPQPAHGAVSPLAQVAGSPTLRAKALGAPHALWGGWSKAFAPESPSAGSARPPSPSRTPREWLLRPHPLLTSRLQIYLFCQCLCLPLFLSVSAS